MAQKLLRCDPILAGWLNDNVGYLFDQGAPILVTAAVEAVAAQKVFEAIDCPRISAWVRDNVDVRFSPPQGERIRLTANVAGDVRESRKRPAKRAPAKRKTARAPAKRKTAARKSTEKSTKKR